MPTNPDDVATGWGNKIYLIGPDSVYPRTAVAASISFAPQFRIGRTWMLGLGLNFTLAGISPHPAPAFDDNNNLIPRSATNEVNVGSGLPLGRGVGTSLVYYTVTTGANWIPGASVQFEKQKGALGWVLDSRLVDYRNVIEEGWDRYNSFSEYQRHTLGTTYMAAEMIGLRIGGSTGVVVSAGPAISFATISSDAPGASVNFKRVGILMETAWYLSRKRHE